MQHDPEAVFLYAIVTFFVADPIIFVSSLWDLFEVVTGNYLYVPLFSIFITPMIVLPLMGVKKVLSTSEEDREGSVAGSIFLIICWWSLMNACITFSLCVLFFHVD